MAMNPMGGGILSISIKEKNALYAAYMPFLKQGGLFIPSNRDYTIGDEVFMRLTLMDDSERLAVAGKVVWTTPRGAQGAHSAGIGVEFSPQDKGRVRGKIETLLAGGLESDHPTHTM